MFGGWGRQGGSDRLWWGLWGDIVPVMLSVLREVSDRQAEGKDSEFRDRRDQQDDGGRRVVRGEVLDDEVELDRAKNEGEPEERES